MLSRTRFVLLGTVSAFALSACAYLSGQNQSCPPVQEISDPMTAALPPMPKPPPKEEYEATATPTPTETAPVAQTDDAGAAATGDGGAIATATAPDAGGGKPKSPPVATGGGGGGAPACGDKANPCPLQKFMRTTMSGAASDPAALQAAFAKLAGLSPNGAWAWRSIAQKGADSAKAGDVAEAKKQCKACHDQYREQYKQQYRARKF